MKLPLCILALLLAAVQAVVSAGERPNILFFLIDDLGYYDLSLTGSAFYETPNIDALAASGVLLTQAYSAFPRCIPSRYAMMTGVHPSRGLMEGESLGDIPEERVTLAEAVRTGGYKTFFAGKWHLGKQESRFPQGQGFDINIAGGSSGSPGTYFAPYTSTQQLSGPELLKAPEGEYLTDRLTEETVSFIREQRGDSMFIYLSHYAVHTPLEGKPGKVKRYKDKANRLSYEGPEYEHGIDGRELRHQNNAAYAAMIESVDESIGRIMRVLDEEGLAENTIVIFTSDHGGLSNSGPNSNRELATSNLPLRAGKGHLYEGGIRVPVIIKWPDVVKEGSRADFPITGMDYYPTILEMAGLELMPDAHEDGLSFVPGLKGQANFSKERSLFWYSDFGRRSRTGDFNAAVIRKGPYKLMEFFNEKRLELYDLANDQGESKNLSESLPGVRDRLYKELLDWKLSMKVKDAPQSERHREQ